MRCGLLGRTLRYSYSPQIHALLAPYEYTLIEKRDYLPALMRDMVALTDQKSIPWVTLGRRSKKGHPHHPLYLRKDEKTAEFDIEGYLKTL